MAVGSVAVAVAGRWWCHAGASGGKRAACVARAVIRSAARQPAAPPQPTAPPECSTNQKIHPPTSSATHLRV